MSRSLIAAALLVLGTALLLLFARPPGLHGDGEAVAPREPVNAGASDVRGARPADPAGPVDGVRAAAPGPDERSSAPVRGAVVTETPDAAAPGGDPVGLVVHGRVTDPGGDPVRPAWGWVWLTGARGEEHVGKLRYNSYYSILGLRPGRWQLVCRADGYRPLEGELVLVAGERVRRHDLVLEPALQIRIDLRTPDGRPLYEVLHEAGIAADDPVVPVATSEHPGPSLPARGGASYRHHEHGVFRFANRGAGADAQGCAGHLEVRTPLPAYVSLVQQHLVLETRRLEEPVEVLRFTVSLDQLLGNLGSVRLRVLDADTGAPLPEARVALGPDASWGTHAPDAGGVLVLERVRPGPQRLVVEASGRARLRRVVDVQPGSDLDLGDVVLESATAMRGTVVDPDGAPVSVDLIWGRVDRAAGQVEIDWSHGARSDASGAFEIPSLAPTEYLLRTVADSERRSPHAPERAWASAGVLVDVRAQAAEGVRLVVHPYSEVVLQPSLDEGQERSYRVCDATGFPIRSGLLRGSEPRRLRLAPGSYELELRDGVRSAGRAAFTVRPADASPAESPVLAVGP